MNKQTGRKYTHCETCNRRIQVGSPNDASNSEQYLCKRCNDAYEARVKGDLGVSSPVTRESHERAIRQRGALRGWNGFKGMGGES